MSPTSDEPTESRVAALIRWLVWPDLPARVDGRVIVCHEWLVTIGGSDKVAAELAAALDADYVIVLAARQEIVDRLQFKAPVIESRLGKYVRTDRRWQWLLPLMPLIWVALDLRRASLVMTSSHAFANCVRAPRGAKISYCYTPMRYAWEWRLEAGRLPRPVRPLWPLIARLLRTVDAAASRTVDHFVTSSLYVRSRIARCYGRDAVVVNPPIDLETWNPDRRGRDDFVLVAGRMVAYKRPDVAIEGARLAGLPVVVAGSGPGIAGVAGTAGVSVVEDPDDEQLRQLYRRCSMFAFAAVEDFGMMPLEAQACGAPVVAMRAGGSLETVHDGATGLLVDEQTPEAFAAAIRCLADAPFEVLEWATAQYGRERFTGEIRRVIDDLGCGNR